MEDMREDIAAFASYKLHSFISFFTTSGRGFCLNEVQSKPQQIKANYKLISLCLAAMFHLDILGITAYKSQSQLFTRTRNHVKLSSVSSADCRW